MWFVDFDVRFWSGVACGVAAMMTVSIVGACLFLAWCAPTDEEIRRQHENDERIRGEVESALGRDHNVFDARRAGTDAPYLTFYKGRDRR